MSTIKAWVFWGPDPLSNGCVKLCKATYQAFLNFADGKRDLADSEWPPNPDSILHIPIRGLEEC
jgi:hypothetical protein